MAKEKSKKSLPFSLHHENIENNEYREKNENLSSLRTERKFLLRVVGAKISVISVIYVGLKTLYLLV